MSVLTIGILFGLVTLLIMFSGISIAFALGIVAIIFMYFFMPSSCRDHTIVLPDTTNPSLLKNATAPYCKSTFNSSFLPGTILNHFARVIGF